MPHGSGRTAYTPREKAQVRKERLEEATKKGTYPTAPAKGVSDPAKAKMSNEAMQIKHRQEYEKMPEGQARRKR